MSDASHSIPQRAALAEEEVEDVEEVQEEDILEPTEQTLPDRSHEMESAGRSTLEVELASKEREVSHLVDEMQRLQSSINNLKEISTSKISQLQGIVTEKDRIIKELAEKLLKQQDYSDLKRELRLLKSLELGGWQSWCSDQTETASPAEVKLVTDGVDSSAGPIALPGEESRSPGSGVQEEPIPVLTPPSALELTPPSAPEPACVGGVSVEQLQHCLRVNVDRFSNESLNTLSISRCVRELLSMNNIGQRLFAKLVLGLSQGTVSELLSKPKPWDKLTEKGRDSYRKMHAWACDQHCISLLKSLLPKKGRESGLMKQEGSVTEERVSQLMNEAQNAVLTNGHSTPDKQEVIALPKESIDSRREIVPHSAGYPDMLNGSKALHYGPEFPPVMLAHIYQEELVKLIGKRIKEGYTDDHMKQAQDDIRQALSIYHRELALLAQGGPPPPPDSMSACHTCSVRRSDCGLPYCRDQPCCMPPDGNSFPFVSTEGNSMKVMSPYSGTSPLVPLSEVPPTSDESSPLQRMQSITNSLLSQSSTPTFSTLPQRPAKAILPPITQQQFDQYNNLNTEDIVKKVKEQLSQYSISQRLFGESVLGLSQGSVSDLLARPKPWHMLTQKGREPFIRMKMFLEDENAVHKLVASQYKIAPERLMRMGGYGGVAIPPGSTRFSPHVTEPSYPLHRPMLESRQPIKPAHPASPQPPSTPESPAVPLTAHSPSGSAALPSSGNLKPNRRGHARCLPYVQPSVYEMAAVTTDLDTQMITSRIKETLTVHNIGQKLFGEAVLGLSQGSVSELLSKPKPWHMLSIKGREPFIRMQLWLNDPSNVEKLQAIKTERREANKRRRSSVEPDAPVHCEKPPQYPLDLPPVFLYPPVKKPRILFSEEQKEALKLAYTLDPYPSTAVMEFLSSELGLSVRTITNWFHNHRMRLKQQQPGDVADQDGPPFQQQGIEGVTFDPIRFRMMLSQRLAEMCSKPPPQQSQQQQAAVYAGDLQRLGPPYRLCQPLSPPEQEVGTLDLSMSSQQFPHRDSREQEPLSLESERSTSATPETQSETHDSKCQSESDNSQLTPTEDRHLTTVATLATSSSNRRKAAAPQWVNPVLDLSPDSDLCSFGEDDEEDEEEKADTSIPPKHIINGVCVRQTNLAIHEDEEEATVHIEPAPVPDSLTSLPAEGSSQVEQQARIEREKNIRRLERALAEQEESWDITESEDDENSSNDYADSSRL